VPSRNGNVTAAACPICDGPMPAGRARPTCSDACRQTLWRRRHQPAPTQVSAPPVGVPRRPVTVYECASCGTRQLGDQYCHDCNTFMNTIGYGGNCPHCAEPVAHTDLQ
jgi:endogenous inhibitor of DNA gyrase (YacG/DUF329 family)